MFLKKGAIEIVFRLLNTQIFCFAKEMGFIVVHIFSPYYGLRTNSIYSISDREYTIQKYSVTWTFMTLREQTHEWIWSCWVFSLYVLSLCLLTLFIDVWKSFVWFLVMHIISNYLIHQCIVAVMHFHFCIWLKWRFIMFHIV